MFRTFKVGITFIIIALLLTGLNACTAEAVPKLRILGPWARPAAMGGNAAVYLTLVNNGKTSDAMEGASSDAAEAVNIHKTQMAGNVMSMVQVPRIEIPAGGRRELKTGGFHVMLVGLKRDLNPGDTVSVMLRFEKSAEITVDVEVRDL
jgi:hypothetical protein